MKILLSTAIFCALILSACGPASAATQQSILPSDDGDAATPVPTELTPAQRAAISLLASTLSLPPEKISLVSTEVVEWPDGCLGVQKIGTLCTQAIVPGFRIILQAKDSTYEVRTDEAGTQVVLVEGTQAGDSAEQKASAQLAANLGLDAGAISVLSNSEVEFGDACLGVSMLGMTCAQVVTPGRIIVLEADGIQFEYHVNSDGTLIQPATLALNWTRNGGIAGFCNALTVFLSGEVYGSDCRTQPEQTIKTFTELMPASEQKEFFDWVGRLGVVNVDASDPEGVSDRMLVTLEFFGNGKNQPGPDEDQALLDWAQNLYQKLFS